MAPIEVVRMGCLPELPEVVRMPAAAFGVVRMPLPAGLGCVLAFGIVQKAGWLAAPAAVLLLVVVNMAARPGALRMAAAMALLAVARMGACLAAVPDSPSLAARAAALAPVL